MDETKLTWLKDDPSPWHLAILAGLQRKPMFAGINPDHPTKSTTKRIAKQRAKNKRARAARRINR